MEGGDPEESDEDVQGSTVLWEKCIQQSIFVDLSEDESLHFSDLEASLDLHLSQAESPASGASIHLSGSALSVWDGTSSESSVERSPSERVVEDKTKSSILHESVQRPNTEQNELTLKQGNEEPGQDTSDEDQEDLPYDGDLGSPYFNQTTSTEGDTSSDGRETIGGSPDGPGLLQFTTEDEDKHCEPLLSGFEKPGSLSQEDEEAKQENLFNASKPSNVASSCPSPADINHLLLRHFTQEELLRPGRLIEAETLPEVSLLESMSWAPTCNSTATNNNHSEIPGCDSEIFSDRTDKMSHTASQKSSLENEAAKCIDGDSGDKKAVMQEKSEEDDQFQRVPLVRTKSFCEMKYGQGQVHYPLPDFSKVAPRVKIPKAPSGPPRPAPPTPSTMHRAQSSPGMLDLISRVLEDSVPQPEKSYVFRDEDKQAPSELAHHLQAEYDKLLTKFGAENLLDQMRLETNTRPSTDLMLYSEIEDDHQRNLAEGSHLGSLAPHLHPSENFDQKRGTVSQSNIAEVSAASAVQSEEGLSDGERMTAELRHLISPFTQKVEEFKMSVSNMSMNTAEQQMMLRGMMEAQDQLERKYMSKMDEHRALERQNYMGLSRNTGTFDPHRLVEGDIFRIGMHLDEIKVMIDKNVCEQISPPHSSSTPMPMKDKLHVRTSPVCMLSPSPPTSLHEGLCAGFSTVSFEMETRTEEEEAEEAEERNSEESDGLEKSSELITTDSALKYTGYNSCQPRSSLERLDIQRDDEEEGDEEERRSVLSEGLVDGHISAHESRTSSTSIQRTWTPERRCTPDNVLIPEGECYLGDDVSLAVDVSSSSYAPELSHTHSHSEPPLNSPCVSQRIVSTETDSGFGSSYLNRSASGSFQPNLLIESVSSHNNGLSGSDSDGSCSNLQTTIHPVSLNIPHPSLQTQFCGAAAAVELWVESTTTDPSVRLQGSDPGLPALLSHCVSEPVLSTTMDLEERGSQVNSCSCNSEAILALQAEVSRLKKDLEEGLVQLPHLAQKMDYLTSKYRHDRQERRSKTRASTHLRQSSNSSTRVEDWISSDMEPSKSKGTDSGDTAGSDIMLQFHSSSAGSRRGSSMHSGPEVQYKHLETLQSSRGTKFNYSKKTSGLTSSILKGGASDCTANQSLHTDVMESLYSRRRWSPLSSLSLQKPLLQVSYGSSSSLPASYKLRELPQSMSHHRKRSSQSDTALLPSNVFFQRTLSPASAPSKTVSRTGTRRGSKEEEMNRTLDQAIEVALRMKRTTDRMAKRLSADLGKAQLYKKLHNTKPLGGRKHHAS